MISIYHIFNEGIDKFNPNVDGAFAVTSKKVSANDYFAKRKAARKVYANDSKLAAASYLSARKQRVNK
jgi:hypothetical protein